jgi:hypothetical protein
MFEIIITGSAVLLLWAACGGVRRAVIRGEMKTAERERRYRHAMCDEMVREYRLSQLNKKGI